MIMNNRKQMYDETGWERVENKMKLTLYRVMHDFLQSN